jgi:glutamyl-tRNA synthetase
MDELVDLVLVDFDFLLNKRKLDEEDDFLQHVNPVTRYESAAFGGCLAGR